jgi:replicative DNA helicase
MLLRTAAKGNAAAFFSLEMTKEQLGARMLTDLAYVQSQPVLYEDILNRRIRDERHRRRLDDAKASLETLSIFIEEQRGLTVSEIAARSRKIAAKLERDGKTLRIIFVDHMMLVQAADRYSGNRVREVGEISEGLTLLAQELDVAVVCA